MQTKKRTLLVRQKRALLGATVLLALGTGNARAQSPPFPDVPANHWAYEAIESLAAKGLVKGYPDGRFLGNRTLTRYEFASALDRVLQTITGLAQTPGTAAPRSVTQDDLNRIQVLVDAFRSELAAIQSNVSQAQTDLTALRQEISALRTATAAATTTANRALASAETAYGQGPTRRFGIGGFAQFRHEINLSRDRQLYPQGTGTGNGYNGNYNAGTNQSSFKIREARIFFTGGMSPNARYLVELATPGAINTSAQGTAQTFVRRALGQYTFGDGSPKNISLVFGQINNPFGFAVSNPRPLQYQPERPLAFNEGGNGLFSTQEFDRGIRVVYAPQPYSVSLALVNGSGATSNDTNRIKDVIARATYALNPTLSVGVSGYEGDILTTQGTNSQKNGRKRLGGVDLQYTSPAGPFLQAEYVGGTYEAVPFPGPAVAGSTPAFRGGNKVDGYYAIAGYTFAPKGNHPLSLVATYDAFRRSRGQDNFTDNNVGVGLLYNLDRATRFRVFYTQPTEVAHPANVPEPNNIGLLSSELQVRF